MKSKFDSFLESFNKSVFEVTKGSYGGKWPMPFFTSLDVGMVIGNYWGDFLYHIIEKLKGKYLDINDIVKKIKYPSPFSRVIYPNVELKVKKYPIEKIKKKIFLFQSLCILFIRRMFFVCRGLIFSGMKKKLKQIIILKIYFG